MEEDKKVELQKEVEQGTALSELRNHRGYKELVGILKNLYDEAFLRLTQEEDNEARATINALENIISKIDDTINLGEDSRNRLKEETFKKHQTQNTSY